MPARRRRASGHLHVAVAVKVHVQDHVKVKVNVLRAATGGGVERLRGFERLAGEFSAGDASLYVVRTNPGSVTSPKGELLTSRRRRHQTGLQPSVNVGVDLDVVLDVDLDGDGNVEVAAHSTTTQPARRQPIKITVQSY